MQLELEDEIQVIESIYDDDCEIESLSNGETKMTIKSIGGDAVLCLLLAADYPTSYPHVSLSCSFSRSVVEELLETVSSHVRSLQEKQMIYSIITEVSSKLMLLKEEKEQDKDEQQEEAHVAVNIFSGKPVTEKKSKFQAFVGKATTEKEAHDFVQALLRSSKKIRQATHNIMAYRLANNDQQRDDDGESGAGDKLLYLLDVLDAKDLVVVVTRWYGGIQLGHARFKIIVECARNAILEFQQTD